MIRWEWIANVRDANPAGSTALERLTFLDYQVRLNQAARDSLLAAMNL